MRDGAASASSDRAGRWSLIGFLVGTGLLTFANGSFNLLVGPTVGSGGHSEVVIGVIVATGSVASLLLRVPAGNAYRTGRAAWLIGGGSFLAAAGYGLFPWPSTAPALACLSALQGAGFAIATTAAMASLIERRPERTSAASLMGWYTGSIGAGYAFAGFIGGPLADRIGLTGAILVAAGAAVCSGVLTASALQRFGSSPAETFDHGPPPRGWVRGMPIEVWLGFAIAVYINVVNGGMNAFFPLYALALGLSLSQVGILSGIHAGLASVVRFGAGSLLHRVSYVGVTVTMVAVTGGAITAVVLVDGFAPFVVLVALTGLARGVLRVVSGAMVMEAAPPTPRHRGRASGIYLAGLDLGNAVGPLIGGFVAGAVGLRGAFPVLGILPALGFLALSAVLDRRRARVGSVAEPGPVTPGAP